MANTIKLQHPTKIATDWNASAKQFDGIMVFIALFNALISLGLLFNAVYVALRACVHYFLINLGVVYAWDFYKLRE